MDDQTLLLIEHIALVISELLPFVPFVKGNSIIQTIAKAVVALLQKNLDNKS